MLNMSKGLEALKETAIQIVEAIYGKEEPVRTNKINELLETIQFKCIEKELKALEIIKRKYNFGAGGCLTCHGLTQEEYDLLKEAML